MRPKSVLFGLLLATLAEPAIACGHCVEDKIAAVYDHAIITRALVKKHQVAFFAIDGPLVAAEATRRMIESAAESAYGVDQNSTRVSIESASLSVSFDPGRASFAALRRSLERKLARSGLTLLPMRVMDRTVETRLQQ